MNTPHSHQFKNEHEQKLFEQLDEASFTELERLVRESEGAIDWKTLSQDGVCETNGKVLEGIIWTGNLDLRGTNIESLGKLKQVGGDLFCENVTTLKNLGALEEVSGWFFLRGTSIESLGKIRKLGGNLDCYGLERLKDLGELEEMGGDLDLRRTRIESLGKIKKIGGNLDLGRSSIESLGILEEVGGNLDLRRTSIKSLGKVKNIRGYLYCEDVKTLKDLGALEEVSWWAVLRGTSIESLGKIRNIGIKLDCCGLETLKDLGALENVGEELDLRGTRIESLGDLKKVGSSLFCENLKTLKDLGALEEVLGDLDLRGTSTYLQIQAYRRVENKLLTVKNLLLDQYIITLFINDVIDRNIFEMRYGNSLDKITTLELHSEAGQILFRVVKEAKQKRDKQIAQEVENWKSTGKAKDANTMKETQARIVQYESEYQNVVMRCQQLGVKV